MELQTLGHATLVLRNDDGTPLLVADPWLLGSCYWRSWWLEHPPDASEIAELARARYVYLTHEHPDHFHPPSVRRLGAGPLYLTLPASAPEAGDYLRAQGFRARALEPLCWYALSDQASLLVMPCIGGDTVLLIATPKAVIINLNDARPSPLQIVQLRRLLRGELRGRTCILLASYSSAGLANSFRRNGTSLTLFDKRSFARFVSEASRVLGADMFLPFASHVVYRRPDSAWANQHRVSYDELAHYFDAPHTELLAPYSRVDLQTGRSEAPRQLAPPEGGWERKVEAQTERERATIFDSLDVARLEAKLRGIAPRLLGLLFPRGIGFRLGVLALHYDTRARRLLQDAQPRPRASSFDIVAPAQAVKDALQNGHLSDICIPMFTFVELHGWTIPHLLYLFFLLVSLHDHGGLAHAPNRERLLRTARLQLSALPAPKPTLAL